MIGFVLNNYFECVLDYCNIDSSSNHCPGAGWRKIRETKYEIRDVLLCALRGSEDRCGVWALMRVGVVSHHRIIASSLHRCVSCFIGSLRERLI